MCFTVNVPIGQSVFDGIRIGDCLMQQLLRAHLSLTHLTHLFHVLLEVTSTEQGMICYSFLFILELEIALSAVTIILLVIMAILPSGHTELVSKCHGCAVHKNMLEVILWCIGNKVLPQSVGEFHRLLILSY